MGKSITELRASAHVGLPERTYRLCLATKVMAEVQDLCAQLEVLEEQAAQRAEAPTATGPKRRAAEKSPADPLRARLAELREEMDEHTGVVTLGGVEDGTWRLWCDEHPPRPGNPRDATISQNFCNADDLVDDLETYVRAWNGEPLGPGDWEFIRSKAPSGDLKQMAATVVEMHETVVDLPKLLSVLRGIPGAATS